MDESLLVGETVMFTFKKDEPVEGVVLDKLLMKDKATDQIVVTGYMIKMNDGALKQVAYWRIISVVDTEDRLSKGPLQGGFRG